MKNLDFRRTPHDMTIEKFTNDAEFHRAIDSIVEMNFAEKDYIHHSTLFTGHVNLARTLALYELYRKTDGLSGHIAEAGVWKGATFLFLAKLVEIFEPRAPTQVHGFDWFKGMSVTKDDGDLMEQGSYTGDKKSLERLIELQKLDNICCLHDLDLANDLEEFLDKRQDLRFKLVFLDAGTYDVVKSNITHFWPRLETSGIMVFDEYLYENAPGETKALREMLPDAKVQSLPWTRAPNAYIIK
jgi:O-methyltransferase